MERITPLARIMLACFSSFSWGGGAPISAVLVSCKSKDIKADAELIERVVPGLEAWVMDGPQEIGEA